MMQQLQFLALLLLILLRLLKIRKEQIFWLPVFPSFLKIGLKILVQ
jgi:hypothetical protein